MTRPLPDRDPSAAAVDADARAEAHVAQDQDAIDLEAATWAVRRRDGLRSEDRAELQAWLDQDPRHAAALGAMAATVARLRQLPRDDVAAIKRGLQAATPPRSTGVADEAHSTPGRPRWRVRLDALVAPAVAAAVVGLVGAGWLGWDSWRRLPTFEQAFTTERGQQFVATLPDDPAHGSTVQLDTATRLDARLFRDRREVRLQDGQALFSIHADKDRPFHVWAGQLHITVVGTRFSVRHTRAGLDAGQTVVSVEEGHVRVAPARPGGEAGVSSGPPIELAAGQMVTSDDTGAIGPVTRVAPGAVAPWRNGRLSFDNTPLSQALAEFERYRSTGLVIRDPAVGRLPVGGSYRIQQFGSFVDALPQMLQVRLVPQGELTEIVARRR